MSGASAAAGTTGDEAGEQMPRRVLALRRGAVPVRLQRRLSALVQARLHYRRDFALYVAAVCLDPVNPRVGALMDDGCDGRGRPGNPVLALAALKAVARRRHARGVEAPTHPVERAAVGDVGDDLAHNSGLFGHYLQPPLVCRVRVAVGDAPGELAVLVRPVQPGLRSRCDARPLVLREAAEHLEDEPAARGRGVYRLGGAPQR